MSRTQRHPVDWFTGDESWKNKADSHVRNRFITRHGSRLFKNQTQRKNRRLTEMAMYKAMFIDDYDFAMPNSHRLYNMFYYT